MAAMNDNSPLTTRVLFNLKDLGIEQKFITKDYITMESEKYICIRETNSVVIIDMTKPMQPIKLPITTDSAKMNPNTPILAFKVEAKLDDGTTHDQLQIFDIEAKITLKSCNVAKKLLYWKWITPELLGLVTREAIYHWSIKDSTALVKMSDMTDKLATHMDARITNYVHDPSEKWLALIGEWRDPKFDIYLFIRPYQSGQPWFSLDAHAAAFATFNVEGNDTPSTLVCCAVKLERGVIKLSVSDVYGAQPGKPPFTLKQFEFSTNAFPIALQISEKYGLIYVITRQGLIIINDLETAEAIGSCKICDVNILHTTEGTGSGSFYSINNKGQVFLTNFVDSTILPFLNNKLLRNRGKLRALQQIHREMSNENERIKKKNTELQNESTRIKGDLKESLSKMRETEKQLSTMSSKIDDYQILEKQMLNDIGYLKTHNTNGIRCFSVGMTISKKKNQVGFLPTSSTKKKTQNVELQNEKDNIMSKLEKSQKEIRKRDETTKQLESTRTEMLNEIRELKRENGELQNNSIVTHTTETLQVETVVQREIKHLTSKMTEIERLTKQNTELTKRKDKVIENLTEFLKVEQDARRETEELLKSKKTEICNYQKSQEEMMSKIDDFRLLIKTNNLEVNFTEYSYAELQEVTNHFNDSLKIGEGGYGPVYKAFLGLKPVAIKILKYENSHGNKQFIQEVEVLSKIRHPNLVMMLGACREAHAIVYELLPNGNLYDMLRNRQQPDVLTWKTRIRIASDICSALICLHSAQPHGIVHGDLKPANILLDLNYTGKLSDFGMCRHLQKSDAINTPNHITIYPQGTPPYMDPEYLNTGEMTTQYDVYSFGIVLLELVTGKDPKGLRKSVNVALQKGQLFVDSSVEEWPLEEATKMARLGLRCSDLSGENRPDLVTEVTTEIESMLRASLLF